MGDEVVAKSILKTARSSMGFDWWTRYGEYCCVYGENNLLGAVPETGEVVVPLV